MCVRNGWLYFFVRRHSRFRPFCSCQCTNRGEEIVAISANQGAENVLKTAFGADSHQCLSTSKNVPIIAHWLEIEEDITAQARHDNVCLILIHRRGNDSFGTGCFLIDRFDADTLENQQSGEKAYGLK